jgi:CGNR zinc finger/Putative stress-induced transcription regulator
MCRFGIEELLVVANTRHGPGGHRGRRARADEPMHDHLADPTDARRFLADHEIEPPPGDPDPTTLAALRLIRTGVRALAGDTGASHPADVVAVSAPALAGIVGPATAGSRLGPTAVDRLFERYPLRLASDGRLVPAAGSGAWRGLVADLLPAFVDLRREVDRLRMCGNPLCRFLFIDRSRNASRVWCEMAVCGNRVRGRRHRLRHLAD